jgi:hypothetical protein
MSRLWKNHGLSIAVGTLFVAAWMLQTLLGWGEFVTEQTALGEDPQVLGPNGYLWSWGRATFENWQSEFLQVFVFIVLTTFLVHRRSHESPDTDYQTEAALRRIEARLASLEGPIRRPDLALWPEATITPEQVEAEHLREVSAGGHWAYLLGVVAIGFILSFVLLAVIHGAVGL